jgi:hypothetical protein
MSAVITDDDGDEVFYTVGILRSAAAAGDADEATRRLLAVLELVTSCQDSGCPRSLIAGGRMAGLFDEVDGDIDRCLLELGVANRILITRLEGLLHRNAFRSCDLPPPPPSPATIGTETETTVTVRIGMPRVEHIEHRVHMVQGSKKFAYSSISVLFLKYFYVYR